MPGIQDIPNDLVLRFKIDAEATAGSTDTWPLFVADSNIVVTAVRWIPKAAVTGAATNNFAFQVQDTGPAGAGTGAVSTVKTYASGTNSVALTPEAFTIGAAPNVASGDVVSLVRTVNGTGLASPAGTVEIQFRYR